MGKAIVVTSGKGGVGKTTTTANIGTGLALLGKKVCVVDADIGLRNLDVVMGLENRIVYNIVDVVEGYCRVKQALIKDKRVDNLFLLPAAQTRQKDAVNPEQMRDLISELKNDFDYVIVDCPAGIEHGFQNAIAGVEMALIVSTPEVSAVRDADRIVGILDSQGIYDMFLVINKIRPDMVRKGDMMDIDDMNDILALNLIGVVPDDEGIIVSTNKGEPAVLDKRSPAGQAFRNISKRIEGVEVPFMNISDGTMIERFMRMLGVGGKR